MVWQFTSTLVAFPIVDPSPLYAIGRPQAPLPNCRHPVKKGTGSPQLSFENPMVTKSNDIIAGNGRILILYNVVLFEKIDRVWLKLG